MERAVILTRGSEVPAEALPLRMAEPAPPSLPAAAGGTVSLDALERAHIEQVLKTTGFHKSRSAEILGISRKTLDRKIVEYGLVLPRTDA